MAAVFGDEPHEHIIERDSGDFDPPARNECDGAIHDHLQVMGRVDVQSERMAIVAGVGAFNSVDCCEDIVRRGKARQGFDFNRPRREALRHFADCGIEDFLAAIDQDDLLAELFGLRHLVGREKNRPSFAVQFLHNGDEHAGVQWIKTREWLVEHDEVWLMQHGSDELNFLLHSLAQFLATRAKDAGKFDALEPSFNAVGETLAGESFESTEIHEKFADAHPSIHASFFGQIANAIFHVECIAAEHAKFATVLANERHDHADRCALARAVWAEQSDERAARHTEVEIHNGRRCAEAFVHASQMDCWLGETRRTDLTHFFVGFAGAGGVVGVVGTAGVVLAGLLVALINPWISFGSAKTAASIGSKATALMVMV